MPLSLEVSRHTLVVTAAAVMAVASACASSTSSVLERTQAEVIVSADDSDRDPPKEVLNTRSVSTIPLAEQRAGAGLFTIGKRIRTALRSGKRPAAGDLEAYAKAAEGVKQKAPSFPKQEYLDRLFWYRLMDALRADDGDKVAAVAGGEAVEHEAFPSGNKHDLVFSVRAGSCYSAIRSLPSGKASDMALAYRGARPVRYWVPSPEGVAIVGVCAKKKADIQLQVKDTLGGVVTIVRWDRQALPEHHSTHLVIAPPPPCDARHRRLVFTWPVPGSLVFAKGRPGLVTRRLEDFLFLYHPNGKVIRHRLTDVASTPPDTPVFGKPVEQEGCAEDAREKLEACNVKYFAELERRTEKTKKKLAKAKGKKRAKLQKKLDALVAEADDIDGPAPVYKKLCGSLREDYNALAYASSKKVKKKLRKESFDQTRVLKIPSLMQAIGTETRRPLWLRVGIR